MVRKTPQELAGVYEMTKDTSGNEKKGLFLKIYPACFGGLCVMCGVSDKESIDKCCCPCVCTYYCPWGEGYAKFSNDICAPMCINPQDDGTVDGTYQGIYAKKETKTSGAPASTEMER